MTIDGSADAHGDGYQKGEHLISSYWSRHLTIPIRNWKIGEQVKERENDTDAPWKIYCLYS